MTGSDLRGSTLSSGLWASAGTLPSTNSDKYLHNTRPHTVNLQYRLHWLMPKHWVHYRHSQLVKVHSVHCWDRQTDTQGVIIVSVSLWTQRYNCNVRYFKWHSLYSADVHCTGMHIHVLCAISQSINQCPTLVPWEAGHSSWSRPLTTLNSVVNHHNIESSLQWYVKIYLQ